MTTRDEELQAALQELNNILMEAESLAQSAHQIISEYFPQELPAAEAYGAFDFCHSSNPYDTTLASIVMDIEQFYNPK